MNVKHSIVGQCSVHRFNRFFSEYFHVISNLMNVVISQILVQYFPSILTEFSSFSQEGHKFQTRPWNLDKSQVKPFASQESSFIKTIKMHAILFNLYLGRPRFIFLREQSKKNIIKLLKNSAKLNT